MSEINDLVAQYFRALHNAVEGVYTYLEQDGSPLYKHDIVGKLVAPYLTLLNNSLVSWEHKMQFAGRFRIAQSESGFPAFQNVLELESDHKRADERLEAMQSGEELRAEMVDIILRNKEFPKDIQRKIAEREYLEAVRFGEHFKPNNLPETVRVSVNPKTKRPYYVVHWASYDGSANLPMIYMATIEDSSDEILKILVDKDGQLNHRVSIPLPVGGLLNSDLAEKFDKFCEANSSYSLTLATIASNMDEEFFHLHPKQLRRFVLGPFYQAGITNHSHVVKDILKKVRKPENAWMMTWAVQEIYSMNEQPMKKGLWASTPAREEYYINTDDLDCARLGVSAMQQHALVPHDAYQAIYAAGMVDEIFKGYEKHIFTGKQVLTDN